jgi:hypothetical protein
MIKRNYKVSRKEGIQNSTGDNRENRDEARRGPPHSKIVSVLYTFSVLSASSC